MKAILNFLSPILLFVLLLNFSGCVEETDPCATDFDQTALLDNLANNVIWPAYTTFKVEADSLQAAQKTFVNSPTANTLSVLRAQFQATWVQWHAVAPFGFGPAEDLNLAEFLNNSPTRIDLINNAVNGTAYDLSTNAYSYARGFAALDYLLYGLETDDATLISTFSTNSNASQFLADATSQINTFANNIYSEWNPNESNYLNTFIANTGIAAGNSISLVINSLNANYEIVKNEHIGLPLGAKVSYLTQADKVQALYSKNSKALILSSLKASKNVFEGGAGQGLDDYLNAAKAKRGETDLSTVITEQFNSAISLIEGNTNTWYDIITNDLATGKAIYAAAQNQVVYIKTDLPAALCVSITYIDNVDDGD